MRWYIILAHPNPGSFNHAVCHALVEGLEQAGANYEANDLYATGFNPIMAGDDFNQFEDIGLNAAARLTKADGTFAFCGAAEVDHRILGEVSSDENGRRRFLDEVKALGKLG